MDRDQRPDDLDEFKRLADAPEYSPDEIKRIRTLAGLTQAEFADEADVKRATVVYWEMGKHDPLAKHRLRMQEIKERALERDPDGDDPRFDRPQLRRDDP